MFFALTPQSETLHDTWNTKRNVNMQYDVRFDVIKLNDTKKITSAQYSSKYFYLFLSIHFLLALC